MNKQVCNWVSKCNRSSALVLFFPLSSMLLTPLHITHPPLHLRRYLETLYIVLALAPASKNKRWEAAEHNVRTRVRSLSLMLLLLTAFKPSGVCKRCGRVVAWYQTLHTHCWVYFFSLQLSNPSFPTLESVWITFSNHDACGPVQENEGGRKDARNVQNSKKQEGCEIEEEEKVMR